ncbi:MAG: hypothetical protein QOE28_1681 [Solirubrobacteraceae bacterium]|nr:hypothetical protein [Solirubrobacteraceae bacterium]
MLVVGLGDLGARTFDALARLPLAGRLVGASRDAERGAALSGQVRLVASLSRGPGAVEFERLDLYDRDAATALLARLDPDVTVIAASEHTWWRPAAADPALAAAAARLPYGAWLPLQAGLVRRLMEARAAAGVRGPVVCLPFPDVVGPMLAGSGLAPEMGAGNVAEVAAKLAASTAAAEGVPCSDVEVRLVLHHAAERSALGAFASLAATEPEGEPPWHAEVLVSGEALPAERVAAAFRAPYPLPAGRATHALTSAAAVATVAGLLSDEPVRAHVPAPGGRPGGYPVTLSRAGAVLDLPADIDEAGAVAVNERAAAWDGIERIEPDGTAVLTPAVAARVSEVLGVDLARIAPAELDGLAAELRAALGRESIPAN